MATVAASEQAKKECEDTLREVVFQADTNLKGLRAHLDDEKTGVLAVATFTLANFTRNEVTTASFRSFDDKERLRSVLEGFKALVDECSSALSIAERTEAQMCAQYMEDPAVIASAPPELAQQLGRARRELSQLTATEERGAAAPLILLKPLLLSFPVAALGALLLYIFPITPGGPDVGTGMGIVTVFAILLIAVGGGVLVVVTPIAFFFNVRGFIQKRNPQARQERDDAAEAARLRPAKEAEVKALQQRVDNEVAKERIRLERERDALMAKVLKVGKTNAQSSTNQATAQTRFDVVLISIPAEREQREILAVVISQLDPQQTAPRFKALLKGGTALEHSLPIKILTGVSRTDAVALANKLKKGGAKVEIENEQPD
jgi:ribosomal protein L7/L12